MDRLMGLVMVSDAEQARAFYVDTLGLDYVENDDFALVVRSGANLIRLVHAQSVEPRPFAVLGWQTDALEERVQELIGRGVAFLRYGWFQQDALGIWTAPGGAKVAWFNDPDGNVLSLSQG